MKLGKIQLAAIQFSDVQDDVVCDAK